MPEFLCNVRLVKNRDITFLVIKTIHSPTPLSLVIRLLIDIACSAVALPFALKVFVSLLLVLYANIPVCAQIRLGCSACLEKNNLYNPCKMQCQKKEQKDRQLVGAPPNPNATQPLLTNGQANGTSV